MGKGSRRRPCFVSAKEEELRWALFQGKITKAQFEKEMKKLPKPKPAFIWRSKL
jgi:hypothetical protein